MCEILNYTSPDILSSFCSWPLFFSPQLNPWHVCLSPGSISRVADDFYPCLNTAMRLLLNIGSIFPLSTHFCVAEGNQVFRCLYAQALLYEGTMLLKRKWHLACSATRPSLTHLLAIEKVACLAQERLFMHVCFG